MNQLVDPAVAPLGGAAAVKDEASDDDDDGEEEDTSEEGMLEFDANAFTPCRPPPPPATKTRSAIVDIVDFL
jgi:hypothetical protein